jgi:hypothetical protein
MKQNHQKEKHELGHHLVHEENHKKTRFGARRKPQKSTIWCTKKAQKKNDLVHKEIQKKARLGERRKPQKARFGARRKP